MHVQTLSFLKLTIVKQILPILAWLAIVTAVSGSCNKGEDNNPEPNPIPPSNPTYVTDIKRIVDAKCAISGCHDGNSGVVNLLEYGPLKAKAEEGKIKNYVLELNIMPPASAGQLTENEKKKLQCWLDNDAPEN